MRGAPGDPPAPATRTTACPAAAGRLRTGGTSCRESIEVSYLSRVA